MEKSQDSPEKSAASKDLNKWDTTLYPKYIREIFAALLKSINEKKLREFNLNSLLKYELKEEQKLVCAKIIKGADSVVECLNCRMDSSCIICIDCFNHGNHEGHKYKIKTGSSGCCDCGDREAWKPSGFCTKHTGESAAEEIDKQEADRFVSTWAYLFYWYYLSGRKELGVYLVDFLKVITKSMHFNVLLGHVLASSLSSEKHPGLPCQYYEVNLLDNIFLRTDKAVNKQFEQLFIQMFPNYSFKQQLLASYFNVYSKLILRPSSELGGLSYQLLTSHQLVSWVVATHKKPLVFDGLELSVDFQNEQSFSVLMKYITDLKCLFKLQYGANLAYIRLHLSDIANLECLNYYFMDVEQQWKNGPEDSLLTDSFYVEAEALVTLQLLAKTLAEDQPFLEQTIMNLINHIEPLIVLNKCYFLLHRLLSILLFVYFHGKRDPGFTAQLAHRLKDSKVFNPFFRILHFIISARVNPQLRDLHMRFFYFYMDSFRYGFSIDLYMIKLFVRMGFLHNLNTLDFFVLNCTESQIIAYRSLLISDHTSLLVEDVAAIIKMVSCLLGLLTELCVSICQEIYLHSEIFRTNGPYRATIKSMLCQYVGTLGTCNIEMMEHLKKSYLNNYIDEEIKEVCVFDKQRKAYTLKDKAYQQGGFPQEYFASKSSKIEEGEQKYQMGKRSLQPDRQLVEMIYSQETVNKLGTLLTSLAGMVKSHPEKELHSATNSLVFEVLKITNILSKCSLGERSHALKAALLSCQSISDVLDNKNRRVIDEMFPNKASLGQNLSEEERKVRIKEIQRKKLEEMRNKQKSFVKKHESELVKEEEEMAQAESDQCVFCHKTIDNGFLVYCATFSMSNHYANSQLRAIQSKLAEPNWAQPQQKLWANLKQHYTAEARGGRPVLTSCLHPMHYPCFLSYAHGKNILVCPLCKRKTDLIVPALRNMQLVDLQETKGKLESMVVLFGHIVRLTRAQSSKIETEEDAPYEGLVSLIRSTVEVLCMNGMLDQQHFTRYTVRLYQQLLKSVMIFLQVEFKFKGVMSKQARSRIEENSDLLLLSGVENCSEVLKEYVRGSFESLIVLTLADYVENENMEKILKRITEYQEQSPQHSALFRKRSSLLRQLLGQPPFPSVPQKMEVEEKQERLVLINQYPGFEELPEKYRSLSNLRGKCPNCDKIGNNIHLCLVCRWRGCQKCQACSLQQHSLQRHCGNTIYLNIETTEVLLTSYKSVWRQSALYTNDLGNPFNIFKDWEDFCLSEEDYRRIQLLLRRHQIPATIAYNETRLGIRFNHEQF